MESEVVALLPCPFSLACPLVPLPYALVVSALLSSGVAWFFGFILYYSPWSQGAWQSIPRVLSGLTPKVLKTIYSFWSPLSCQLWACLSRGPSLTHMFFATWQADQVVFVLWLCLGATVLHLVSGGFLTVPVGLSGKGILASTSVWISGCPWIWFEYFA